MQFLLATLLLSTSALTSACIYKRAEGEDIVWSYHGSTGSALWHTLSPNYNMCGQGKQQSPINIDSAIKTVQGSSFQYPDMGDFVLSHNGYAIEGAPAKDTASEYVSTLDGRCWKLQQFHFHASSEHILNGVGYPLEAHFVHQETSTGALGVFGIFFEVTAGRGESFFHKMPFKTLSQKGDEEEVKGIQMRSIIAHVCRSKVFNYSGSLTTPPCSEGVSWFVAEKPLSISASQYRALTRAVGFNSRFVQAQPGESNVLEGQCRMETRVDAT